MNQDTFNIRILAGSKPVAHISDFSVASDRITLLFGESGIGKSLTAKALYGLIDPELMDVQVNGHDYAAYLQSGLVRDIRKHSFFVFQEPSTHLNALMTLSEQLDEGSLAGASTDSQILQKLWQDTDPGVVRKILSLYPKPYRPSGGEKQRILLAMAFKKIDLMQRLPKPPERTFFVFDEPTGSLDNRYRDLFLSMLFDRYRRKPFTILLITHDYSIISEVYRNHADVLPRVLFKELLRTPDGVSVMHDFNPQDYLLWLKGSQMAVSGGLKSERVLEFASEFNIFGRTLRLFQYRPSPEQTDMVIRRGETVYLKAPSGMGKTTLAKIIIGLLRARFFSMRLCGTVLNAESPASFWPSYIWGKRVGMVFQHADEALNLESTVLDTFRGLPSLALAGEQDVIRILNQLFDPAITPELLRKKTAVLSGGQKQRLNLLRTLALNTDLVILDEPLNGLDFLSIRKVMELIWEKQAQGTAFLLISHNEEIFNRFIGQENTYYLEEEAIAVLHPAQTYSYRTKLYGTDLCF